MSHDHQKDAVEAHQMKQQMQMIAKLQMQVQDLEADKLTLDNLYGDKIKEHFQLRKQAHIMQNMIQVKDGLIQQLTSSNEKIAQDIIEKDKIIAELNAKINELSVIETETISNEAALEGNSPDAILENTEQAA